METKQRIAENEVPDRAKPQVRLEVRFFILLFSVLVTSIKKGLI